MTQKMTVYRALQDAGDRGVHSFEFLELGIPRAAARIHELQQEGHTITSTRCRYKGEAEGSLYKLVSTPVEAWPVEQPADLLVREQLAVLSEAAFVAAPRGHWEDAAA